MLALAACHAVPPPSEGGNDKTERADAGSTATGDTVVIERLLVLQMSGQTLGSVTTRLEKAPDGTWTTKDFTTFSMTRQGGGPDATFSNTTESVTVYGPDHGFVSEVEIEREAGITITRRVHIEGNEIVSAYTGPGHETPEVERFDLPADYRSALAVDFELLAEFEKTGKSASRKFSTFNADRERFEQSEVTIVGETTFEHGGEVIPAYEFRAREEDGTVVDTIVDHDFVPLKLSAGGVFTAVVVDELPPPDAAPAKIDSELPVEGTTALAWWELAKQEVTVSVDGDDDPQAPALWEDSHYHTVDRDGSRYTMTLLSTRPPAGFTAPPLPMTIDDPEVRRYLDPTPMAQSNDPVMRTLASDLRDGETDSMKVAEAIVESVFEGITKEAGVRGSATAMEVLKSRAGDCTEHAVLVVALMRAAGIPARVVDGIVIASEDGGKGVAGYHAWAEIWLGEWIGVDATVGETGTSARYLQFSIDEPGSLGSGGKMMRSIGRTTIELGPHETYDR